MMRFVRPYLLLAFALAATYSVSPAQAQGFPSKTITIVVQAGDRRKQAGRSHHAGGSAGCDGAARRPHARRAHKRGAVDQSVALQADQLQSRGVRADLPVREIAVHPGGESVAARAHGAGAPQIRQRSQAAT